MPRPDSGRKPGFAAPLAVIMLIAVALLAVLLLEGALSELRTGAAALAESRVSAGAESAVADAFARRLDTSALSLPSGALAFEHREVGADSVVTRIQILGGALARVIVSASSRDRRLRAFAGRVALIILERDSLIPNEVRLQPVGAHWWVATP